MNGRVALFLFVCAACQTGAFAQQPVQNTPPPERAETLVSRTVVFIKLIVEVDGRLVPVQGTGFLVAYPDSRLSPNQSFLYLVTNRHVAEAVDTGRGCQKYPIKETSVTLNLKVPDASGNRQHTETVPNPPGISWVFPDDGSVDLAATPFSDLDSKFDILPVGLPDFMSEEQLHRDFDVGDKILLAGLFAPFEGAHKIQPILRQGILSMIPDAPIVSTLCRPGDVYLADVHAIGGNSGSPVFITPRSSLGGMLSGPSGVPYALLGVVSGYANEMENLTLQIATTFQGQVQGNSGISTIVPAYQVKALLDSAPLQKMRDDYFAAHQKR